MRRRPDLTVCSRRRSVLAGCALQPPRQLAQHEAHAERQEQRAEADLHGAAVAGVERARALALQQPGEQARDSRRCRRR